MHTVDSTRAPRATAALGALAAALMTSTASAEVLLNEVLGSTTGTDNEYIELYNSGPGSVDIGGWQVELWDSDDGAGFGAADAASPYVIPAGTTIAEGGFYLLANAGAQAAYAVTADQALPANAIENSSYTIVLRDGPTATALVRNSVFVTDGGANDIANIAGDLITADLSVGPDGSFLPAGFFRLVDGGADVGLLEFSPQPSPSGTPTASVDGGGDPTQEVAIAAIQGAGHSSPVAGQSVTTSGVVTAVDSNGFYVQDPVGDGDAATSEALFIFTGGAPTVSVGDQARITGSVSEFTPGGTATRNLSGTQIAFPAAVQVVSSGNPLPEPVLLGLGGRPLPSENIDDDAFANFDPSIDGIDYFESLESMRVTAPAALAVAPTNRFGEIFSVVDNGAGATGLSLRGTLNISPTDFNPEKVQIDADSGILPGFEFPAVDVGAMLGNVTGVVSYDFGNFQIHPTEPFSAVPQGLVPETAELLAAEGELTVASYNVLNLDPVVEQLANVNRQDPGEIDDDVGLGRFAAIAGHIVTALETPDVLALQEIQDNDGAEITDVAAADLTLQTLVDAIVAAGGPEYAFIDTPGLVPAFIDAGGNAVSPVGGQPGGNIRVAFLYNPARVSLVEGSVRTLTDPADQAVNPANPFFGGRIPLAAEFEFQGRRVTVVNNHLSSKGGSAPILGVEQPFEARQEDPTVNGSLDERQAQATAVAAFVDELRAADPGARVVVLGDLNEFEFVSPVRDILGASLTNLVESLPENERYSFIFQGNSQALDHILVSDNLADGARFDIVHVNSEFAELPERASDHDPLLAALAFAARQGDLDGDGDIDRFDFRAFVKALGSREGRRRFNAEADFNGNGRVDFRDLFTFLHLLAEELRGRR